MVENGAIHVQTSKQLETSKNNFCAVSLLCLSIRFHDHLKSLQNSKVDAGSSLCTHPLQDSTSAKHGPGRENAYVSILSMVRDLVGYRSVPCIVVLI